MWKFFQPVNIVFGEGEIDELPAHMERLGLSKALIVADPFPAVLKIAEAIKEKLCANCVGIICDVEPNPTIENVDHCAALAIEYDARCIIAVGGGSTIDCAKLAAAVVKTGCSATELIDGHVVIGALPLIAVPTTAGTGSEVTAVTIISDKANNRKVSLANPAYYPKAAIVDPVLTYTCPRGVTASSGIDVLMHAFDAMSSVKASHATDALALYSARIVFSTLRELVDDGSNQAARAQMCAASLLAGLAFSQTGTTGSHATSYFLTAKYRIPHGEACAFTADKWLKINVNGRPELDMYAQELGFANVAAMSDSLQELKKAIGLRMTLTEANIPKEDIPEIARQAMAATNAPNNVVPITAELVEGILQGII